VICPYGTGRVFTNARLFYQHVREWPEIAKINGLNLDGSTPQAAAPAPVDPPPADQVEDTPVPTPLPDEFPGRDALVKAGIITMDAVADMTEPELLAVPGIGLATAKKILLASY